MDSKILGSRYKIIKPLSKGGFGTTYLAEDTQYPDNLKCVVKKLHSNVDNPEFLAIARKMFAKEAKALAKLGKHDQIPRLLAYFEQEREFYLVQEYVRGVTLTSELIINQPWSEAKVIDFLQDLLGIIEFVHRNGVIHRDIKPDNLIRRALDNKLVLVDFGTVKEVVQEQTQAIALTVSVGTQGYMPTEQARGKPRFASDIYAAGMIAVQAFTATHPLQLPEDENGETLWQERANCSPRLKEIISKMVRYHFKERYHSAQEIITNLNIAKNNATSGMNSEVTGIIAPQNKSVTKQINPPPKDGQTIPGKTNQPQKSKIMGIALGGLIFLAVSVLGGRYLLSNSFGKSPQLKQAEKMALAGKYGEAIALAQELPPTSDIKQQINSWSEKLLERAQIEYTQAGKLETARRIIKDLIPQSSPIKQSASELLSGWELEHEFNQSILTIAKEELQQERWQNAQQEVKKIKGTAPYWQQQAEKVIQAAELGLKSAPGVVDLCSKALDLCE